MMKKDHIHHKCCFHILIMVALFALAFPVRVSCAGKQPKAPVKVAKIQEKTISKQITFVGTAKAVASSIVAAEVAGLVAGFPVKEGDRVEKGATLVLLKTKELRLELAGHKAEKERIKANLENAEKELERLRRLKSKNSVAEKTFDNAFYSHRALSRKLEWADAQIAVLEYRIRQKTVKAPFPGFIAEAHTQLGQWIKAGGGVVTLVDMASVKIRVDVPERYVVQLVKGDKVMVAIKSISAGALKGRIDAMLPRGNATARTFPVNVMLDNPGYRIKSGMEALVTFNLSGTRRALVVPKDAIVASGDRNMIFLVKDQKAVPVPVAVTGYFKDGASVTGALNVGEIVVVRGNERLRPGQAVEVIP